MTDKLTAADGSEFVLQSPFGDELPQSGFDPGDDTYEVLKGAFQLQHFEGGGGFTVLETITNFGGHGGQMEVKTWSDRNGDGIFEKYGQKQGCVQKRSPIG